MKHWMRSDAELVQRKQWTLWGTLVGHHYCHHRSIPIQHQAQIQSTDSTHLQKHHSTIVPCDNPTTCQGSSYNQQGYEFGDCCIPPSRIH